MKRWLAGVTAAMMAANLVFMPTVLAAEESAGITTKTAAPETTIEEVTTTTAPETVATTAPIEVTAEATTTTIPETAETTTVPIETTTEAATTTVPETVVTTTAPIETTTETTTTTIPETAATTTAPIETTTEAATTTVPETVATTVPVETTTKNIITEITTEVNTTAQPSTETTAPITETTESDTTTAVTPEETTTGFIGGLILPGEDDEPPEEKPTLWSRIGEYFTDNKTEIFIWIGYILAGATVIFQEARGGQKVSHLLSLIKGVGKDTSNALATQDDLRGGFNEMALGFNEMFDGYHQMQEIFKQQKLSECDRDKTASAALMASVALLEMFTTVFVSSEKLPQGAKDTILMRYANYKKAIEDDDSLKAVIDAAKAMICEHTDGERIAMDAAQEESEEDEDDQRKDL